MSVHHEAFLDVLNDLEEVMKRYIDLLAEQNRYINNNSDKVSELEEKVRLLEEKSDQRQ